MWFILLKLILNYGFYLVPIQIELIHLEVDSESKLYITSIFYSIKPSEWESFDSVLRLNLFNVPSRISN